MFSNGFPSIANSLLKKGKSATPRLFIGLEVLSSASDKAKLFAKNFSKSSSLDDSGISLPVISSGTNLKLHNIYVSPRMIKKVVTNLDLSNVLCSDCMTVMVLKHHEPELSYILDELFNMCLKGFCFPYYWKVSLVVPVFQNGVECLLLKTAALLVFFLWLVKSLITYRNLAFYLIFGMVLGLLDQLQIFWQLYLM